MSAADRASGAISHARDPQDVADLRAYAATIAPVTAEELAEVDAAEVVTQILPASRALHSTPGH